MPKLPLEEIVASEEFRRLEVNQSTPYHHYKEIKHEQPDHPIHLNRLYWVFGAYQDIGRPSPYARTDPTNKCPDASGEYDRCITCIPKSKMGY